MLRIFPKIDVKLAVKIRQLMKVATTQLVTSVDGELSISRFMVAQTYILVL